MLDQSTCVGFGYGPCCGGCFLGALGGPPNPVRADSVRAPSPPAGPGMLTWLPSATPFGLALGAGSPCADEPCAGTLGLPAGACPTPLVATHVSMRAPRASSRARARPSPAWGTLRYRSPKGARGFGARLEPRYIFGAGRLARPVSCYAFFKGWLLLGQPPGCRGRPTSFPT
jgi:hypothetical protein